MPHETINGYEGFECVPRQVPSFFLLSTIVGRIRNTIIGISTIKLYEQNKNKQKKSKKLTTKKKTITKTFTPEMYRRFGESKLSHVYCLLVPDIYLFVPHFPVELTNIIFNYCSLPFFWRGAAAAAAVIMWVSLLQFENVAC